MASSTFILQLDDSTQQSQAGYYSAKCKLKWRQGKLLVRSSPQVQHSCLPALEDQRWLSDCLKALLHSADQHRTQSWASPA